MMSGKLGRYGIKVFTAVMGIVMTCAAWQASAKTVRWTGSSDISTWDIHSQINGFQSGIHASVYETLVALNSRSFKTEPQLATSWKLVAPQQWRVSLRPGVKFHDGGDFTADDVVFSLLRAQSKTSTFKAQASAIRKVEKVDSLTVDIWSSTPKQVLLAELTELRIMSKAWAEANGSLEPKDINDPKQIQASHQKANGTGPFMLKEWLPGQSMTLVKNPKWWSKASGNVSEVIYLPMRLGATRIRALSTQEVDVVHDPNPQDFYQLHTVSGVKLIQGPENRTIMLGMDQARAELPNSKLKGKNPLRDVRVRRALYQAIDIDSLQRYIMRDQSDSTGTLVTPQVTGWTADLQTRLPYDPEAARKLLSAAGFSRGFDADFACPIGRYVSDADLCQAIAKMWAKVGIETRLRLMTPSIYFPMVQRHETSIYLLGWNVPTFDAMYTLEGLLQTPNAAGEGAYNLGRYSNPALDTLITQAKGETDPASRAKLLTAALQIAKDDIAMIPLHNQTITWAVRSNIQLIMRPDNRIDWTNAQVN